MDTPFFPVRAQQFGGSGGGRGAHIGHQIGDTDIHFMAHRTDHGDRAGKDRPCHLFIVKGPKILQRTSPAPDDQYIAFTAYPGQTDRLGDLPWCRLALHLAGIDHHRNGSKASPQYIQNIVYRRPAGGADHTDATWQSRQGAFAFGGKQPLGIEALFQCLEGAAQGAIARLFHVLDHQLKITPWLVQANPHPHQHLHPITGLEAQMSRLHAEHRAAYLGELVLNGKIEMTGTGLGQVGDLALQPEQRKVALQHGTGLPIQARDSVDITLWGAWLHGRKCIRVTTDGASTQRHSGAK